MGVWLGPARRILQNLGQAETATHETQPQHDERKQSQRNGCKKALFGAAVWETVHARDPPPIRSLRAANADFLRASGSVDVATQPQLAAIINRGEFRLD